MRMFPRRGLQGEGALVLPLPSSPGLFVGVVTDDAWLKTCMSASHVAFGVVKAQLHPDHLGVTMPGYGLQVLRPNGLPFDSSRQLNLVLFTSVTHHGVTCIS